MITARRTRLVRVPDLHAFRLAIADCLPVEPAEARATAVLVPTMAAAAELRTSLENNVLLDSVRQSQGPAVPKSIVWPDIVTRAGFYAHLYDGLARTAAPAAGRLLSPIEREVLLGRASREAIADGWRPPFRASASVVGEMLSLLDSILRLGRTLEAFERLLVTELEAQAPVDRGAERLLAQTTFLVAAFTRYRALVADSGFLDEHLLRDKLLVSQQRCDYRHVVVTSGDRSCSGEGLWPVDFDLLARLPHLERIDVIATESVLASGFHERLQSALPEFEEVQFGHPAALVGRVPQLVTEAGSEVPYWQNRDREEELSLIARSIKQRAGSDLDRVAVICKRPLPYVYLARARFTDAGIPFQAFDELPLAAEPFAAGLDLILRFIESRFSPETWRALAASPHFSFPSACDIATVAEALAPLTKKQNASEQFRLLIDFIEKYAVCRGGAAQEIVGALVQLREAHVRHDDPVTDFSDLVSRVRHWIEAHTFSAGSTARRSCGVHLVDAVAAPYGDFDEAWLVGLIDHEWPDTKPGSIFYPSSLLAQLGWPAERLHLAASRAAFKDLVRLPGSRVQVSTFILEEDALVEPSPFLDDVERMGVAVVAEEVDRRLRISAEDALSLDPVCVDFLEGLARQWAEARRDRSRSEADNVEGRIVRRTSEVGYSVRRLETYLDCPFKYFAETVLKLTDEQDDDPIEGPRAQGKLLHEILAAFYEKWQSAGNSSVDRTSFDAARQLFREVVDEKVATMEAPHGALWRARLLGSATRAGIGEVVLRHEAATGERVIERLLEYKLEQSPTLSYAGQARTIRLRGVADRIDILDGHRLRIIDYKLGRSPDVRRAIQLPLYGIQAQQQLGTRRNAGFSIADAAYLAFGERQPAVPVSSKAEMLDPAIADAERRALEAVEGIERGDFPVRPANTFMCTYCAYSLVCRKEYADER